MSVLILLEHDHNEISSNALNLFTAAQKINTSFDVCLLGDALDGVKAKAAPL